jgi:tRNA-binding EMAP/Myf-like protein
MADRSEYKVGVVLLFEEVSKKGGKPLKALKVDVGNGEEDGVHVVTSAPNVREGSRVVVALAGSAVLNEEGDENISDQDIDCRTSILGDDLR